MLIIGYPRFCFKSGTVLAHGIKQQNLLRENAKNANMNLNFIRRVGRFFCPREFI